MTFEEPYNAIVRRVLSSQRARDKLNCAKFATVSARVVASSAFNTTELQTHGKSPTVHICSAHHHIVCAVNPTQFGTFTIQTVNVDTISKPQYHIEIFNGIQSTYGV